MRSAAGVQIVPNWDVRYTCPGRGRDGTVAQPRSERGRGVQAGAVGVVQGAEEGTRPVQVARGAHRERKIQGTAVQYAICKKSPAHLRESAPLQTKLTAPTFVVLCVRQHRSNAVD